MLHGYAMLCLLMLKYRCSRLNLSEMLNVVHAGRVYSKRSAGKLVFYDLKADGEKVQVMADVATSGGDLAAFVTLHNSVKVSRAAHLLYQSGRLVNDAMPSIGPTLSRWHVCTRAISAEQRA